MTLTGARRPMGRSRHGQINDRGSARSFRPRPIVTRQTFRQRPAFRFAPPGLDFRIGRGSVRLRFRFGRRGLRDLFLEIADDQSS